MLVFVVDLLELCLFWLVAVSNSVGGIVCAVCVGFVYACDVLLLLINCECYLVVFACRFVCLLCDLVLYCGLVFGCYDGLFALYVFTLWMLLIVC